MYQLSKRLFCKAAKYHYQVSRKIRTKYVSLSSIKKNQTQVSLSGIKRNQTQNWMNSVISTRWQWYIRKTQASVKQIKSDMETTCINCQSVYCVKLPSIIIKYQEDEEDPSIIIKYLEESDPSIIINLSSLKKNQTQVSESSIKKKQTDTSIGIK